MIIKDYTKNPLDGSREVGRVAGRDYVPGGIVGYYQFETLGLWAWLFIPEGSLGEYQNQRSPENYTSLLAARAAALAAFGE